MDWQKSLHSFALSGILLLNVGIGYASPEGQNSNLEYKLGNQKPNSSSQAKDKDSDLDNWAKKAGSLADYVDNSENKSYTISYIKTELSNGSNQVSMKVNVEGFLYDIITVRGKSNPLKPQTSPEADDSLTLKISKMVNEGGKEKYRGIATYTDLHMDGKPDIAYFPILMGVKTPYVEYFSPEAVPDGMKKPMKERRGPSKLDEISAFNSYHTQLDTLNAFFGKQSN